MVMKGVKLRGLRNGQMDRVMIFLFIILSEVSVTWRLLIVSVDLGACLFLFYIIKYIKQFDSLFELY